MGHYIAARTWRVRVETTDFGSGPVLLNWRLGSGLFRLRTIPAGGNVRFINISQQQAWVRLAIILAGPLANVGLGLLLFTLAVWLAPDLLVGDAGAIQRLASSPWKQLVLVGGASVLVGLVNLLPWPTWDGGQAISICTEGWAPAKFIRVGLILLAASLAAFGVMELLTIIWAPRQ